MELEEVAADVKRMVRGITNVQVWANGRSKVTLTLDPEGADALVRLRVFDALTVDSHSPNV